MTNKTIRQISRGLLITSLLLVGLCAATSSTCYEGDVEWCGQCLDVTGQSDVSGVIQACIDNAPNVGRAAYKVNIPAGSVLLLEQGVQVNKPMHIDFNGSQVRVGSGITAFNFVGGKAQWSKVENLEITTALKQLTPDYDAVGFDLTHGVRLDNIYCSLLGVCVLSDSTGAYNFDGTYKNVNAIQVHEFRAADCGTAFYFEGSDANIGTLYGLEITRCDTPIFDSSSYGNHVFGAYVEVSRETGIVSDSLVNQSVYTGVTLEATPDSHIPSSIALILGGSMAKDLDGSTRAEAFGFQHGYGAFNYDRGEVKGAKLQLGSYRPQELFYWTWPEKGETEAISLGYDDRTADWVLGWYGRGLYDGSKPFRVGGRKSDHRGNYKLGVEAPE